MLRTRIEKWCNVHGYNKMDNIAERKNKDGKVTIIITIEKKEIN